MTRTTVHAPQQFNEMDKKVSLNSFPLPTRNGLELGLDSEAINRLVGIASLLELGTATSINLFTRTGARTARQTPSPTVDLTPLEMSEVMSTHCRSIRTASTMFASKAAQPFGGCLSTSNHIEADDHSHISST